jgi:hypothetical protein
MGSRTRDLPACRIAPDPTTLPHAQLLLLKIEKMVSKSGEAVPRPKFEYRSYLQVAQLGLT